MATSIDDDLETYQQAYKAYVQRNYEEAATFINQAVLSLINDPNTHLLRGHIYYVLQHYDVAKEEYQKVLELTEDPEIVDFANNGLENISYYQQQVGEVIGVEDHEQVNFSDLTDTLALETQKLESEGLENFNHELDSKSLDEIEELHSISPFDTPTDITLFDSTSNSTEKPVDNPFGLNQPETLNSNIAQDEQAELELPAFLEEATVEEPDDTSHLQASDTNSVNQNVAQPQYDSGDSPFAQGIQKSENQATLSEEPFLELSKDLFNFNFEDETFSNDSSSQEQLSPTQNTFFREEVSSQDTVKESEEVASLAAEERNFQETSNLRPNAENSSSLISDFPLEEQHLSSSSSQDESDFNDETFDLEAFDSAFGSQEISGENENISSLLNGHISQRNNIEFLDDFDEFDDLGHIPGFDNTGDSSFGDSQLLSRSGKTNGDQVLEIPNTETSARDAELFSITGSHEAVPVFTQTDVSKIEPQVTVEQGLLAPLENAPLENKQWLVAGTVGIVSALVVATVSFAAANFSQPQQRESVRNTGWAMTLAAGIAGFATAGFMGSLSVRQIRRTTKDLQAQFDAVRQGNLNVQATVYSEDEFGQLASSFNEMARVMFTTTSEATRKAQEQEEAKENLQRQVIRLLDDVEGAARGDLTVQAEVTADVLGAVADAFNLTIQNLRDIVQQVKVAAREVTKGATNSETFARALSSDALRQAEELGVTLSSVQVMTDSIQRVAEAAREAETVARDASEIALKGGDAVENTVAGILEIRETVAETTRKVKRLAESSQEISKIVALISQIASRTNLLALNASIEAARAGEAGRGFAIVADEVRQLADKSAKSLKEIEQIVMQIQSETGSVMTAMEEGTQQVIQGTKLAEEAKRSLENIIQVAKRIDILVRSITTDTVEQTETSRAVAQVMQSVELTAQDNSQEAQRVSGALQHLVGVSRDLIASVERFRVETAETR